MKNVYLSFYGNISKGNVYKKWDYQTWNPPVHIFQLETHYGTVIGERWLSHKLVKWACYDKLGDTSNIMGKCEALLCHESLGGQIQEFSLFHVQQTQIGHYYRLCDHYWQIMSHNVVQIDIICHPGTWLLYTGTFMGCMDRH